MLTSRPRVITERWQTGSPDQGKQAVVGNFGRAVARPGRQDREGIRSRSVIRRFVIERSQKCKGRRRCSSEDSCGSCWCARVCCSADRLPCQGWLWMKAWARVTLRESMGEGQVASARAATEIVRRATPAGRGIAGFPESFVRWQTGVAPTGGLAHSSDPARAQALAPGARRCPPRDAT